MLGPGMLVFLVRGIVRGIPPQDCSGPRIRPVHPGCGGFDEVERSEVDYPGSLSGKRVAGGAA